MTAKVLLIDDDPDLGRLVDIIMRPIGVTLYHVYTGLEGLKGAYSFQPDLVILDLSMPEMDGFDVCTKLREITDVPVLILTARTAESDMLRAFRAGADDFVKKPFNKNELEVRVRALLRRAVQRGSRSTPVQSYYDCVLDIDLCSRTVRVQGDVVRLTPREYALLDYLVRVQGKIATSHEIMREVWGEFQVNGASIVALNIYYLRKKLQDGQYGHQYIRTNWGRGYWFECRPQESVRIMAEVPNKNQSMS